MGNIDGLRAFYPAILDLNRDGLAAMNSELDQDSVTFFTGIYFDLHRYRQYPNLEGWITDQNHFEAMDTSIPFHRIPIPPDILSATHHMVAKALAWLGIGMWVIAESYYKTALLMDFASNDFLSALICGANLGLCYLGGEDIVSAYRLTTQLLPLAIRTKNAYPGTRIATIKRLSLARMGKWDEVHREAQKLQASGLSAVDDAVDEILTGIYQSIEDYSSLGAWQKHWKDFKAREIRQSIGPW